STFGVNGIVTDLESGDPLQAKVYIDGHDMDNSFVYADPANGYYQRLLKPGTYDITYAAPGHYPVTVEDVVVTQYAVNTIDVQLDAGALIADFTASVTAVPIGGPVDFFDESFGNPVAWEWTFEGGVPATSTVQDPEGIYWEETGSFDVSLTITDGDGNQETITKSDFISVNAEFLMSNQAVTTCTGIFYDTGGESGNYSDNEDFTMTFMPATAGAKLIVDFELFDVEYDGSCDYDWLKIYDGPTASASALIDIYCGTNSPGTVEATNEEGALTFEFHSDYSVNKSGWKALISCTAPSLLPVADFTADQTHIDQGQAVNYTDQSTNNPTSWAWMFEGGDPASSSEQNPSVTYSEPGIYDVTLIVQNPYGSDSKTMIDYITVDSTIGMLELLSDGLKVYPNPVTEDIISLSAEIPIERVELYDLTGKRLISKQCMGENVQLRVQGVKNGIYLLKVLTNGRWQNARISVMN
ncbi:MAG: PKD domain-containing protein, partial [Bacteroidales bacterium]